MSTEFGTGHGYCSATVKDAFTFVNTHLSTRHAPLAQFAQALELLARFRDPPTVLVGDFNSGPTSTEARAYDLLTRRYTDAYAVANGNGGGDVLPAPHAHQRTLGAGATDRPRLH